MSKAITQSKIYRTRFYSYYRNKFINLYLNRFRWINLPYNMEQEYIEKGLLYNGVSVYFNDENIGHTVLPANLTSDVNVYGLPNKWYAQGFNYNKEYNIDNSVLIRNNRLMTSSINYIDLMANKLADIEVTLFINEIHQRIPYIFKGNDKSILSIKTMWKKVLDGEPAIFTDKMLDFEHDNILDTKTDFLLKELNDHKTTLLNEVYTELGINNINIDKKERLISDEVNGNNQIISESLDIMLSCRQESCYKINKMFGTNISCELKESDNNGSSDINTSSTGGE